jgi:hypothetical protein
MLPRGVHRTRVSEIRSGASGRSRSRNCERGSLPRPRARGRLGSRSRATVRRKSSCSPRRDECGRPCRAQAFMSPASRPARESGHVTGNTGPAPQIDE